MNKNTISKQQIFTENCKETGDAYTAAISAGYSPGYAKQKAKEFLQNTFSQQIQITPNAGQMQEYSQQQAVQKTESVISDIKLEDVVKEIADIGFGRKFLQEMDKQGEIILVPPSASITLKALEILGKALGMFGDKLRQTDNENEMTVTIKVVNGEET